MPARYAAARRVNEGRMNATERLRVAKTATARREALEALDKFKHMTIRFGNYQVRLLTDPDKLTETMKGEGPLERYK